MQLTNKNHFHTIIIGGGAAGFFSAIQHKEKYPTQSVLVVEHGKNVLQKVKISGGGRCNVTHACYNPMDLTTHYPRGQKELKGPFHIFQPKDTIAWFKKHGVNLKTESDNRLFPTTNSSQTIIDCFLDLTIKLNILIWKNSQVTSVKKNQSDFELTINNKKKIICKKLILATGSNKKGYELATSLGHSIINPRPSLFTFKIQDKELHQLSGSSVKQCNVFIENKKKQSQLGPILITHWGLSGPSILKLSAWQAIYLHSLNYTFKLTINWFPDSTITSLQKKLFNHQHKHPKQTITTTSPFPELSQRLWSYLIKKNHSFLHQKWSSLTQHQIDAISTTLTNTTFNVIGKSPYKDEFVTCGGVDCKEINFKNMESKCCPNLHIIGECLNIDGETGGFNFQNAWTTAYLSCL